MEEWIISIILGLAIIDTFLFTTHSTRSAFTSKVKVKWLLIEDILKREYIVSSMPTVKGKWNFQKWE